jgi:hypothetical protein
VVPEEEVEPISDFRHFGVQGLEQQVILESLHRELPIHEILVHGTLKRSGPFDPTHREPLNLVCEFPYQNPISAFRHFGVHGFERQRTGGILAS